MSIAFQISLFEEANAVANEALKTEDLVVIEIFSALFDSV